MQFHGQIGAAQVKLRKALQEVNLLRHANWQQQHALFQNHFLLQKQTANTKRHRKQVEDLLHRLAEVKASLVEITETIEVKEKEKVQILGVQRKLEKELETLRQVQSTGGHIPIPAHSGIASSICSRSLSVAKEH